MRPPRASRKQRGIKRRREKEKEEFGLTLAAPSGQGRGPYGPSMAFSLQQPRATTKWLAAFFSRHLRTARLPIPGDHVQQELFQSGTVAGNRASGSRDTMRLGRNQPTLRSAAPDERVMNALHKMQDYLQQIMVISQKTVAENVHRASRIKDEWKCRL